MSTVWDFMREVSEEIAALHARVTSTEGVIERMHRKGTVTDVDAKNQVYRQQIGLDDQGQPVKSPWIPYGQVAGALKVHSPPSVGQQMLMVSPDGDHEQAFGMPLTFSTDNASPSQDPGTDMSVRGKSSDTQTKDGRTLKVGNASIALTDGMIVLTVGGSTYKLTDGKAVTTATTIAEVGTVHLGSEDASRALSLQGSIDSAGHTEQGNLATKVMAA